MLIGEILIREGVITAKQLQDLLRPHRSVSDWKLIMLIGGKGLADEDHIMKVIAVAAKLPYFADLQGLYMPNSSKLIPRSVAYRQHIAPLFRIDKVITCAVASPFDPVLLPVAKRLGFKFDCAISSPSMILATLDKIFGAK